MPNGQVTAYDYVYPKLGRAGLGNLLFPWARSVIAAERLEIDLLPPKWFKIRIGPILRGDIDKRRYHLLFRRQSAHAAARREWVLRTATLWDESGTRLRRGSSTSVLVIETMDGHFAPLNGSRELVRQRLLEAARPEAITSRAPAEPYVALHVRLGDFRRVESDTLDTQINRTTPLSWFVDGVHAVRGAGWDGPIVICSDGTDEELEPLLSVAGTTIDRSANALADMLKLANARLIIGSGSSFSAWGSYLGGVPVYLEPGMNHFGEGFIVREVAAWDDPRSRDIVRVELAG